MNDDSRDAAWVHAHLHRLEGDLDNAGYWYRVAGRPAATSATDREWERNDCNSNAITIIY